MRMIAAFVLPPRPRPSQKPAPRATTFFSAPHSSTPATSLIEPTRKVGQSSSRCHTSPFFSSANPTVDSQKSSRATSLATFAPINTETSIPFIASLIMFEIKMGPPSSNSMPLIRESARAPGAIVVICGQMRPRNWCGSTKTRSVASVHALARSGSATMFSVNLMPGRYLTFSWSVLMISVRFLPSTCSSYTHILTSSSNSSRSRTLRPMIFAIAEPQLPEPTIVTFSLACELRGGLLCIAR